MGKNVNDPHSKRAKQAEQIASAVGPKRFPGPVLTSD